MNKSYYLKVELESCFRPGKNVAIFSYCEDDQTDDLITNERLAVHYLCSCDEYIQSRLLRKTDENGFIKIHITGSNFGYTYDIITEEEYSNYREEAFLRVL